MELAEKKPFIEFRGLETVIAYMSQLKVKNLIVDKKSNVELNASVRCTE